MVIFSFIKNILTSKRQKVEARHSNIDASFIIPRDHHCISRADINPNALKVLRRLAKAGYESFLVGGSVRDLLLRKAPKDFDIATDAHPEEVRKLFRNCRLIGRRFRLAHVFFGRQIIEVATFRANTEIVKTITKNPHGIILRDNVYGTLEEDAWRRDFTVNALYYNITNFSIVDYTSGMADLEKKIIRMIGEPEKRYQEDPVRMLRAVRFAAKLNFTIEEKTAAPLSKLSGLLLHVPSARLFDEVIKIFHSGNALAAFTLLNQYDLFKSLFPQTAYHLSRSQNNVVKKFLESMLLNTDTRINQDKPVTPAFLFAAFLWHDLQATEKKQNPELPKMIAFENSANQVIQTQLKTIAIPKRLTKTAREIWFLQYRFHKRAGSRAFRTLSHPRFRAGYDFLLLRATIGEVKQELADWWTRFQSVGNEEREAMVAALPQPKTTTQNE
ncbi:MAG: polynucleotide adenylyltransferase PcnB [Proteobacteria bacterium]|nr:polynucleotide adenylyltransferase PcnB [Pseudomonadota bacterium]